MGPPPRSGGGGSCEAWWRGRVRAPILTFKRARTLRRQMTLPEVVLWRLLRGGKLRGLRFRRQHPIGPYILDFYCPAVRLAVEVEGMAHDNVEQVHHDERRVAWLAKRNISVLWFAAADILKDERVEGVLWSIVQAAAPSTASGGPPPPLRGGGTGSAQAI
jgi:very-short-patch-repair endonuclease